MRTYPQTLFSFMKSVFQISAAFILLFLPKPAFALTLNSQSVLRLNYEQSLSGRILKLDPKINEQNIRKARSQYDTALSAQIAHTQDKSARASTIFGTESNTTQAHVSLDQNTPAGTLLGLDFFNTRESTDAPFATSGILYHSQTRLRATQPLAQNAFGAINRKTVSLARQQYQAAIASSQARLQDLAYQNLNLYWTWYWYGGLEDINRKAVSAAQALYQANRQKLSLGLIEEADLAGFLANLNIRQSDLYTTQAELAKAEADLKIALNLIDETLTPGQETLESPDFPPADTMIARALQTHPDLAALKKDLQAQNIQIAIGQNSLLPQIDLFGSLAINGIDPTYADALENIPQINPLWMTGVNLSFPLQNRSAKADFKQSQLIKKQKLFALKLQEDEIVGRIRSFYAAYQKALSRLDALSSARKNQLKKWQGEIRRYDQGRSDPDLVIRYQNDYLEAQKLFLQAQIGAHVTKLQLTFAQGRLSDAL